MKFFRNMILISAMVALGTLGAAELPGEDDLVFRYVPSDEPALAETGGSVQGTFQPGNTEVIDDKEGKALRFRNPGSGSLSFPLTGNLTPAEGTILMDIACEFDPAEVHAAVLKDKKWSKQYFLLRADKDGKGVAMFLDIISKAKADGIAVSVMTAAEQHQWKYTTAYLDSSVLPRGKKCTVGFTWKGNRFAVIANGKVYPAIELPGTPAWGPTVGFGGVAEGAFPGLLYEVRSYRKSAL